MAHFQIFLPGRRDFSPDDLAAPGLDGLLRDGDRRPTLKVGTGPDGGRGLFLVWQPNEAPGCWPDRQTWLLAKPRGQAARPFWIGIDGRSPTPADLEREPVAFEGGTLTMLGDGNLWTVPGIRWICFLASLNPRDRHCQQALESFAALDDANRVGQCEQIFAASLDVCLKLLQLNYRITPVVCHKLELFEVTSVAAVLAAAIEAPHIQSASE